MHDLVIKRGRVIDYATGTDTFADVAIERGVIVAVDSSIEGRARRELDADGLFVLPGLVDLHVHLSQEFGGAAGHAMLARAGVTTALDLGTLSTADVRSIADLAGTGLTVGCVVRLMPGVHVSKTPTRAEIKRALQREISDGALGVKIHIDAGWTIESAALIAEVAHDLNAWTAIHCGTVNTASNLAGLKEAIDYLDGKPAQLAHINSYCRGDLSAPESEAAQAIEMLRGAPQLFSESYLSEWNGNIAECADGLPVVARVSGWLVAGGFPGTQAGLRDAIIAGYAAIPVPTGDDLVLTSGEEGVIAWEDADTKTALCLPINPAGSRLPLAWSKNECGAFDVSAIATDGGAIPRNVTVSAGLHLVELGAMTLPELVKKASWTPAQTLGLTQKGSIAPSSDADICLVDPNAHRVVTTIAGGRIAFDGNAVSKWPATHMSHQDSEPRRGDLRVDVNSSGLFTGAGRR
jgi:cytosine/adenosine deaminase-related metal-dependent hydrolase